jgi:hypothetical protein
MMEPPPYKKREPVGPIVAIVIIVIVMAVGGIYFFIKQYTEFTSTPVPEEQTDSI